MLGRGRCRRGRGLCGRRLFGRALREGMWEVGGRTLKRSGGGRFRYVSDWFSLPL